MKIKKILSGLLFAIASLAFVVSPAAAAEVPYAANQEITIEQTFEKNSPKWNVDDTFTYSLTGLDGAPMPEGADGQVKTFSIKGNSSATFVVHFEHPGNYAYEIKQIVGEKKDGYKYDERKYTVRVSVTNSPDGGLTSQITKRENEDGKSEEKIVFKNSYFKEVPADKPTDSNTNTSVQSYESYWQNLMLVSFMGIVLFLYIIKREKDKREGDGSIEQ